MVSDISDVTSLIPCGHSECFILAVFRSLCTVCTGYSIADSSSGECYDGTAVSRPDLCEKRKTRSRSSSEDSESPVRSLWSLLGLDDSFSLAEHEWTGTQKSLLMAGLIGVGMVFLPRAQFAFNRWLRYRHAPVEWGAPNFAR